MLICYIIVFYYIYAKPYSILLLLYACVYFFNNSWHILYSMSTNISNDKKEA